MRKIFLCFLFITFSFCSQAVVTPRNLNDSENETEKDPYISLVEQLTKYAKRFKGTPYVWGGTRPSGFDCSGFVRYVFAKFDMNLTHSSRDLAELGYKVEINEAYAGDLIFFRSSRNPSSEVSHVGIVVSNDEKNGVKFIHSASRQGVTQSYLNEKYYSEHFVAIKRVVDVLNDYSYD